MSSVAPEDEVARTVTHAPSDRDDGSSKASEGGGDVTASFLVREIDGDGNGAESGLRKRAGRSGGASGEHDDAKRDDDVLDSKQLKLAVAFHDEASALNTEEPRVTTTWRIYRLAAPVIAILVILPVMFPPEGLLGPFPAPALKTVQLVFPKDTTDCNVFINKGTTGNTDFNLVGVSTFLHELQLPLTDNVEIWLENLGLNPVCRVTFTVPPGERPRVYVNATSRTQVFVNDVELSSLIIAGAPGTTVGLFGQKLVADYVAVLGDAGRVETSFNDVKSMDITFDSYGYVDVHSDKGVDFTSTTRNDAACTTAPVVSGASTKPNEDGDAIVSTASLRVAAATAPTQTWSVSSTSIMVVGARVGAGTLAVGDSIMNVRGVGASGVGTGVRDDSRQVRFYGLQEDSFTDELLKVVAVNVTGRGANPGVFLLSALDVYTYLPVPVLRIMSGGVLEPRTELVPVLVSTCPSLPVDCNDHNASVVRTCTIKSTKEQLPLDPFFDAVRAVADPVELNGRDLWKGKPLAYQPNGDDRPFVKSNAPQAAAAGRVCVNALETGEVLTSEESCLEARGLSANGDVEAVMGLSLALALLLSIAIVVLSIAVAAETYGARVRSNLILGNQRSRKLALGVMESFRRFGAMNMMDQDDCKGPKGCCRMGICCTRPRMRGELFYPNHLRADRMDLGFYHFEPDLRGFSDVSYINKLEFILQKYVVSRDGDLWGTNKDQQGLWCCARDYGKLKTVRAPVDTRGDYVPGSAVKDLIEFTPCPEECGHSRLQSTQSVKRAACCCRYSYADPDLLVQHAPHCHSTIRQFDEAKKELNKFLHMLQYVNDQTSTFYLVETLFPHDPVPAFLREQADTAHYKLCENCKEQEGTLYCKGCRIKLCKICEKVIHLTTPEHKDAMIELRHEVLPCANCRERTSAFKCADCVDFLAPNGELIPRSDGKPQVPLCGKCEAIIHKRDSHTLHDRTEVFVCNRCNMREAPKKRYKGGRWCDECKGLVMDEQKEAERVRRQFEGGDDRSVGDGSTASSGISGITSSGFDPQQMARELFYTSSHAPIWEAAVLLAQMALVIAPTIPLLALSDVLIDSFARLFGPSLGPAGAAVRTASTTFRAWSGAVIVLGGCILGITIIYPIGYTPNAKQIARRDKDIAKGLRKPSCGERCGNCCRGCLRRILAMKCLQSSNQMHTNIFRMHMAFRIIFLIILGLTLLPSVAYVILVCLWVLLGVFIELEAVLPYAVGVVGTVLHVGSLWSRMIKFYHNVKEQVQAAITELQEGEDGLGLATVTSAEIELWLSRFGLTRANIIGVIASSTAVLVWVLAFLYLGIGAFSDGSTVAAVVNAFIVAASTFTVNQSAGDDESPDRESQVVEMIVKAYKKSLTLDTSFEFSVKEDITSLLTRASEFFG